MTTARPSARWNSQQQEISRLRRWFGFTARDDKRWVGGTPPAFGFEISNRQQPLDLAQPGLAQGTDLIRDMIRLRSDRSGPRIVVHENSITIAAELLQANKVDDRDVFARHAWMQGLQTAALVFSLLNGSRMQTLLRPELRAGLLPGLDSAGRPVLQEAPSPFVLLAEGRNNHLAQVDLVDIPPSLAGALQGYRAACGKPGCV